MVQRFASIFGVTYLIVGILGFVPGILQPAPADPDLAVHASHGLLLGLFPVNLVHNLVHMGIGLWGIVAARDAGSAVFYSRTVAVIFALLTILGIFPFADTMFGLAPIHGHDVWLHALTAAVAAYFGYSAAPRATAMRRAA